jgi:hypothetical protein
MVPIVFNQIDGFFWTPCVANPGGGFAVDAWMEMSSSYGNTIPITESGSATAYVPAGTVVTVRSVFADSYYIGPVQQGQWHYCPSVYQSWLTASVDSVVSKIDSIPLVQGNTWATATPLAVQASITFTALAGGNYIMTGFGKDVTPYSYALSSGADCAAACAAYIP